MKELTLYYWEDESGVWHKQKSEVIPPSAKQARRAKHYVPRKANEDLFIDKLQNTPPVSSLKLS